MNVFTKLWQKLFGERSSSPQRVTFNGCTVQIISGTEVEFTDDEEPERAGEDTADEVEALVDKHFEARWILRTQAEVDALEQVAAESPNHVRVTAEYQTLPKWWSVSVWTVNVQWFNYLQYLRFEQLGRATCVAKALGERPPVQASPASQSSEG